MMRLIVGALVISVVAVGSAARTGATDDPVAEMAAACPCDARADGAAWGSHGEYVACVASDSDQDRQAVNLRQPVSDPLLRLSERRRRCRIVVGLVAGWLTGKVVRGGGYGVFRDIILGIVGAFIGGFVMSLFGV